MKRLLIALGFVILPTLVLGQVVKGGPMAPRQDKQGRILTDYLSIYCYDVASQKEYDISKRIRVDSVKIAIIDESDTLHYFTMEANTALIHKKIKGKTFEVVAERDGYAIVKGVMEVFDPYCMSIYIYFTPIATKQGKENMNE